MHGLTGGEGGIRTPDRLTPMSDFESGAFNRALPPLRVSLFYQESALRLRSADGFILKATETLALAMEYEFADRILDARA
jgi:hypothetical protein